MGKREKEKEKENVRIVLTCNGVHTRWRVQGHGSASPDTNNNVCVMSLGAHANSQNFVVFNN